MHTLNLPGRPAPPEWTDTDHRDHARDDDCFVALGDRHDQDVETLCVGESR
jgi:hypothetical protein